MMRYRIRQIAFDGADLDRLVAFWSAALGYELDHRTADYAVLRDPDGAEPRIFLQRSAQPKTGKNRAHIDIEVPDQQEAVDRLVGLGASIQWTEDFGDHGWTVLADPEGNEFCVGFFG